MKVTLITNDNHLIWTDMPAPVLKDGEVMVKILCAAVNRADLLQREGNYPPPPGCPEWMGLEVSGIITELTEGAKALSPWKVGDRVCALLGGGGYAEYVAVKYDMLMPIPDNCTMEEAAALPEAFATAYLNLFIEGKLTKDDTFLMHAGASGLAGVVIPMAKAFGARVITTVQNAEMAEKIRHLPADRIIDTSALSVPEALKEELDAGHPVSMALDCLGGKMMGESLPYLKYGTRWIMIATLAGDKTEVDLRTVYVKNIRIIGSTLRSKTPERKAEILALLVRDIWPKIASGDIRPTIYKVLPITDAEAAHDLLYSGKSAGKVVLRVSEA